MKIKKPKFAGSFYPDNKDKLNEMLSYFLSQEVGGNYKTRAIVAPHAGYVYSGKTAGVGYKILGKNPKIKTIVIFAPSHNFSFEGIAYGSFDEFETPLGSVEVDKVGMEKVRGLGNVIEMDDAFYEHSLEVQLPFVQKTFRADVKILPFIVGSVKPENLAKVIGELWKDESVGFVFSTDLSHYLSKDECKKVDDKTIRLVESLNYGALEGEMMCGYNPVRGLLKFAKDEGLKVVNVARADSSEHSGDESQVVGYGSFAVINN